MAKKVTKKLQNNEQQTPSKLSELTPDPRNPRHISDEAAAGLRASIERYGDIAGIVYNTRTGQLVAGHQRVEQLRQLHGDLTIRDGAIHTPSGEVFHVRLVDWEETQQLAANLAANNPALAGEWTRDLGPLLADLAEQEAELFASLRLDVLAAEEEKEVKKLAKKLGQREHKQPTIFKAATLELLAPTEEELSVLKGRRVLIEFSGGKDSSAAAVWCQYYLPSSPIELMFVDMGADFIGFSLFLNEFAEWMGSKLVILRTEKNMIDHFLAKKEWPHFMFPFCQDLLHEVLDKKVALYDDKEIVVVRGGRRQESGNRSRKRERVTDCNCSACPASEELSPDSRWMKVMRLPGYKYFQPLYFSDKQSSEAILQEAKAPVWSGYSRGMCRTACRVCPGQRPRAYAAMKQEFPDIWAELLLLEKQLGPGCWQGREGSKIPTFEQMAEKGRQQLIAAEEKQQKAENTSGANERG